MQRNFILAVLAHNPPLDPIYILNSGGNESEGLHHLHWCFTCFRVIRARFWGAFMEDKNTTIATVHGVTYAWDTLEPVNDTVIDVNSNPPQSIVAKDGAYSFELTPGGDYTIKASYYENNSLIYSKETTIEIEDEGTYVLDLLLYPVSDKRATETVAAKMNSNGAVASGQTKNILSIISYLPVAIALFLPVAIVVAIVLFLLGGEFMK